MSAVPREDSRVSGIAEDDRLRRGAVAVTVGLLVSAVFRWRAGAGAGVAAFVAGLALAVTALAMERFLPSLIGADLPAIDASEPRATSFLRRYEVVFATLAAIVILTRVGGGTFRADPVTRDVDLVAPSPSADAVTTTNRAAVVVPPTPAPADDVVAPSFAAPSFDSSAASFDQGVTSFDAPSTSPGPFADGGQLGERADFATVGPPGRPTGVAVGPTGDVWATSAAGPTIFHLGPDGEPLAEVTVPGAQGGFSAVAFGRSGTLFLASTNPAAVLRFDPETSSASVYATIPNPTTPCAPPIVARDCDAATVDQAPAPSALAFDARGQLYVSDAAQGTIWRVPAGGGDAEAFVTQGSWTNPARPAGPTGIAVDGAGNLVIAVRGTLTDDTGAVYVQKVAPDGSAGELKQLASTGAGSRPGGLVLARDGRTYVTLSGAGRVLVLGADGKELGQTPTASTAPVDTPVGVAFRGQSLLVAAQTPAKPDGGQIVRLPVGASGALLYAG